MATRQKSADADSLDDTPSSGRGTIDSMVIYQALLDIKEQQGEVKSDLRHINSKLASIETKAHQIEQKSSATEKKVDRIFWFVSAILFMSSVFGEAIFAWIKELIKN